MTKKVTEPVRALGPYTIHRGAITMLEIRQALRAINTELFTHGLARQQARQYAYTACWFPHLERHPAIRHLADIALWEADAGPGDHWTQLILQFPSTGPDPGFHRDNPPQDGRTFTSIIGVPLTPSGGDHGGVRFPHHEPMLEPGDLIVFDPNEPHSGGVNRSGLIRYAVYIRTLSEAT